MRSLRWIGVVLAASLLQGCYVFSYYPETDTYVTTVETKKYVNRNYSRERMMEANNSDCYACHSSTRSMAPAHGGYMHQNSMVAPPSHGQRMAMSPQGANIGGMIIMPPGYTGGHTMAAPDGYVYEHAVPTIPAGPGGMPVPSFGSVPPMAQPYR